MNIDKINIIVKIIKNIYKSNINIIKYKYI